MNESSSRSHSVFTLHLTAINEHLKAKINGQLNLCDLAGSERVDRSGVAGVALTEAKNINKSLSALAGVFESLGKNQAHVPFRDSTLTYLLEPALSGNGKTLMIVNLSPTQSSVAESISTLRFGAKVNKVELGTAKRQIGLTGASSSLPQLASSSSRTGGASKR
jgi:kinesin family member C1